MQKIKLTIFSIFILVLLQSSAFKLQLQSSSSIVVILNKENTVSEMSLGKVKLYYLRRIKKRWPENNKMIKPVDRKNNPAEKKTFLAKVLKMSDSQMNQYFTQRQFANAEPPPTIKNSDTDVIQFVSENIGAIGYINKSSLSKASGVKGVLTIE